MRVGDRLRAALLAAGRIHVRAHVQQVDDAGQLVLGADRKLDGDAAVGQLRAHRLEHAVEVGALAVEHVHEHDARQLVLVGARPDLRRVHLDAHHAAEHDERALDDAERRERVRLEAGVARRVEEVDLPPLPLEVRDRAGEGHLAAMLVLVPVAHGRALLDRAEPVRLPGLEQHGLDERGLPDPAVSDDGDVADLPGLGRWHQARVLLAFGLRGNAIAAETRARGHRAAPGRARADRGACAD